MRGEGNRPPLQYCIHRSQYNTVVSFLGVWISNVHLFSTTYHSSARARPSFLRMARFVAPFDPSPGGCSACNGCRRQVCGTQEQTAPPRRSCSSLTS